MLGRQALRFGQEQFSPRTRSSPLAEARTIALPKHMKLRHSVRARQHGIVMADLVSQAGRAESLRVLHESANLHMESGHLLFSRAQSRPRVL